MKSRPRSHGRAILRDPRGRQRILPIPPLHVRRIAFNVHLPAVHLPGATSFEDVETHDPLEKSPVSPASKQESLKKKHDSGSRTAVKRLLGIKIDMDLLSNPDSHREIELTWHLPHLHSAVQGLHVKGKLRPSLLRALVEWLAET